MLKPKTLEQRVEQLEKGFHKRVEFVGEKDAFAIKVNRKIREKYSLSDELALLRKALAKLGINDTQLDEYNSFVENCKLEVRAEEQKEN